MAERIDRTRPLFSDRNPGVQTGIDLIVRFFPRFSSQTSEDRIHSFSGTMRPPRQKILPPNGDPEIRLQAQDDLRCILAKLFEYCTKEGNILSDKKWPVWCFVMTGVHGVNIHQNRTQAPSPRDIQQAIPDDSGEVCFNESNAGVSRANLLHAIKNMYTGILQKVVEFRSGEKTAGNQLLRYDDDRFLVAENQGLGISTQKVKIKIVIAFSHLYASPRRDSRHASSLSFPTDHFTHPTTMHKVGRGIKKDESRAFGAFVRKSCMSRSEKRWRKCLYVCRIIDCHRESHGPDVSNHMCEQK